MINFVKSAYFRLCLKHPVITLTLVGAIITGLAIYIDNFRLDASADSLVLENDKDLEYYRSIRARYGSDDFLIVTYTPTQDLFANETLANIKQLRDELARLERVESVVSLLDVPLIDSPRVTLADVRRQVRTLELEDTDRQLARNEFLTSPLYSNLILSPDGKTTALRVNFKYDTTYQRLLKERNDLRAKRLNQTLSHAEEQQLQQVTLQFKEYSEALLDQEREDIARVRTILDKYRKDAVIYLGGIPMIVADMITYIQHDIQVFGVGVLCFLIVLLSFSFKKPRWVLLPMLICFAAGIGMVGYLGLVEWRVTVVSSNFISLMLIITLSVTIHLVVRYQELQSANPAASQQWLVEQTIRSKAIPSFYTTLTTMVAFGSLLVSGIRPVIDFGWMMVYGVGSSLILAFLIFPAGLQLLQSGKAIVRRNDPTGKITRMFANIIQLHTYKVLVLYVLLAIISVYGITRLTVENRFIDYFHSSTEIYQGMLTIDQQLGGTTPMDVIIDPDSDFRAMQAEFAQQPTAADDFVPDEGESAGISGDSYWFNIFQLETVAKIHHYLESLPETGKVISIATTMDLLTKINRDEPLDNFSLAIMYKRLPDNLRNTLFEPYMSKDGNQLRFAIRIFESDKNLKRQQLLEKIRHDLQEQFQLEPEQIHISGMVVLYNNMLQSLFTSQIMTIGVVFLAILLMFIVLFQSFYVSALAIIPNLFAASTVLGLMGWLGIPLDIMTITIAAITIGIAVDDTIHYIHRFGEELKLDGDYWAAVRRSHNGVGRAMYYTSITITLGFSILALSSFIPTIYFGLLTGVAMMVAMVANLTLLALLLVLFKPFGRNF